MARSGCPCLYNEAALRASLHAQRLASGPRRGSHSLPVPKDFPRPQLAMPAQAFHPDFVTSASWQFCSRRLREVLAQPHDTVEFIPVDLVAGSAGARARDYALMRVLAWEDVIESDRPQCMADRNIEALGTATVSHFKLRPNANPRHEVFKVEQTAGAIFVADPVAERVMRARCTGIEFSDPRLPNLASPRRIRTATGVEIVEQGGARSENDDSEGCGANIGSRQRRRLALPQRPARVRQAGLAHGQAVAPAQSW